MHNLFPAMNVIHHIIVHIPIILLSVAPFLVMVGIGVRPAKRRPFLGAALMLMVLGTAMTFVAVATGEETTKAVGSPDAINVAVGEHRALARTTSELFAVLTLGFAALFFAPRRPGHELEPRVSTALLAIYLVFYATGILFLAHTALQGAQVVRGLDTKTQVTYLILGKERAR